MPAGKWTLFQLWLKILTGNFSYFLLNSEPIGIETKEIFNTHKIFYVDLFGNFSVKFSSSSIKTSALIAASRAYLSFTRLDDKREALLKVPTTGGEPTSISNGLMSSPAISPDGKTIAVVDSLIIKLVGFEGGEFTGKFNIKLDMSKLSALKLQWTADGRGIYFVSQTNGVSNI